ncbi:hypothetical protein Loa_00266 [Legionella oakridgensis ATCC 33761 = DSM 21215]|uniref:Uncharacterized protein n=2 Tax=Legionella oakridgensis TaxID=29423 RepID=W0B7N3_9GAMM|nr:hypothetical protein Loa_00266 [Legionella oakridgensis ATCC 33761 = DSM 21215]KTD37298.1 ABC transporter ATP-binding protein Uup [Legionella oakridgensis]STY15791.1 ABC transporter ATP-binding protein Uup, erythromycin resistance [Legionella longbeachae]
MHYKPIQFKDLSLIYPHKTCFQDFRSEIHVDDRIALISRPGSGSNSSFYHSFLDSIHIEIKYQTHQRRIPCFNDAHFFEVIHHD